MKSSLTLDERVDRAVDNFMAGYGCCQSVVAAFSDLYGLDETMAKRIAGDRRDVVTIRGTDTILKCLTFNPKSLVFKTVSVPLIAQFRIFL
jgi:hypothetical protein